MKTKTLGSELIVKIGTIAALALGNVAVAEHASSDAPSAPGSSQRTMPAQQAASFSGQVLPPPGELPFSVGEGQEAFYSLYRRPNDDTFQNGGDKTNPGTPFQVGWMWCSLVATQAEDGKLDSLDFRWDFQSLTGRHTAAPENFVLRESRSSLAGETEPVRYPLRPRDTADHGMARVSTRYPEGVTEASATNLKRGTLSSSMLRVINGAQTPLADGEYSGNLEVRINPAVYGGGTRLEGLEQTAGTGGPTDGVYKKIDWKVKIVGGKIVEKDVNCARFNENQPLQLAGNNLGKPSPYAETGYPEQSPSAECKSDTEQVGGGTDLEREQRTRSDQLTREVGKVISTVGCLNCHSEGTLDQFRFCDDGRPLWAREDSAKIYSMLMYGVPHKQTPPDYPEGMIQSIMAFRDQMMADAQGSGMRATLREWVESQRNGTRMEPTAREMELLRAAQAADRGRLDK